MTKTPRGRYSQELRQQAVTMAVKDGFPYEKQREGCLFQ